MGFLLQFCVSWQLFANEEDSQWAGWPIPWSRETDEMPDLSVYGRDCIKVAKLFMAKAGLTRAEPRQLPMQTMASQRRSTEDRTEGRQPWQQLFSYFKLDPRSQSEFIGVHK